MSSAEELLQKIEKANHLDMILYTYVYKRHCQQIQSLVRAILQHDSEGKVHPLLHLLEPANRANLVAKVRAVSQEVCRAMP